jgi:hypothetical protein
MLAWRTTWVAKPGRLAEALATVSKALDSIKTWPGTAVRVYTSNLGPSDTLVFEEVWPSIEAHDAWWAVFGPSPEMVAFNQAWHQVVERSTSTELWTVAERKW